MFVHRRRREKAEGEAYGIFLIFGTIRSWLETHSKALLNSRMIINYTSRQI